MKKNVCKLSGALARELTSWQEDVRLRCSQLLCSIVLHAEEGITQNLQDLLLAMYSAARDEDQRVVENIRRASNVIGMIIIIYIKKRGFSIANEIFNASYNHN